MFCVQCCLVAVFVMYESCVKLRPQVTQES